MTFMRPISCLFLLLSFASLAGCGGSGRDSIPITGTVTFDGQPIPTGNITLMAADGKIAPDAGSIVNGHFSFSAKAGLKRVEIQAERMGALDPEMKSPNRIQYIPAKYNAESTLSADVSATSTSFTFDLRSNGSAKAR
jgi:hypothetical protein